MHTLDFVALVFEGNIMLRRFVLVATIVLSTLTMGAGEPGVEPGRPDSSPREDEGRLFNDRGVILLGIGRLDQAIDLFTEAITVLDRKNPHQIGNPRPRPLAGARKPARSVGAPSPPPKAAFPFDHLWG